MRTAVSVVSSSLARRRSEKPLRFRRQHLVGVEVVQLLSAQRRFLADDVLDLDEEPGIDLRQLEGLLQAHAVAEGLAEVPHALGAGIGELLFDDVLVGLDLVEAVDAGLQPAQGLLQRFLEGAADGHHLAHRLHLGGQAVVGLRELLEGEARHLGDDVVDRRLERGRRRAAGDLVAQFVERVADRQLGRHLGDGKARRLRGQRRGARDARIHLDDDHAAVGRIDGELHVGAAGVDADLAQHGDRGVAHDLVFLVRQRLRRRHGDRVAGVHAHRVEVLDRADDDAVVLAVADHLHLEFLPADQRLLDEQFLGRAGLQAALADGDELFRL
jgi:hypothetical protein